jgi:hypothetical protein
MFPRSEEKLSFLNIAEYWSREGRPPASRDELLACLEAAWWRGELVGRAPRTRLQLLKMMFGSRESQSYQGIVFVAPNDSGRAAIAELKDGEVKVDLSPRICVPCEADDWTEDSCAHAFLRLAEAPSLQHFPVVSPVLCSIEVAREEFFQWVEARLRRSEVLEAGQCRGSFGLPNGSAWEADIESVGKGRTGSTHC